MPMEIPVIDLDVFITGSHNQEAVIQECKKAAEALIDYGALVLHDSRVLEKDNAAFLDIMEDYFNQPVKDLRKDERFELGYYVGFTESLQASIVGGGCPTIKPEGDNFPRTGTQPNYKFYWHMNKKAPYETQPEIPTLTSYNVVPDFPRWDKIMDQWGQSLKNAVADVAEMIAIGLDLPPETFKEAGQYGPHILGPTGTDLVKYGQKGTILTNRHSDVNFLTIHGRSRYPGLDIWTRNLKTGHWQSTGVEIPTGNYFLVQAGKQLEHISGGLIKAGPHEVIVNDRTLKAIEQRKVEFPKRPLIRVSSTLFWHLSPDYDLVPIAALKDQTGKLRAKNLEAGWDEGDEVIYEPIKVREQVRKHDECSKQPTPT